jgi:hypothetical protein
MPHPKAKAANVRFGSEADIEARPSDERSIRIANVSQYRQPLQAGHQFA